MKNKLTLEDATMMYNRWVSGQANKEFNAMHVKYKDLLGKGEPGDTDQGPNTAKAGNVLPYQIINAVNTIESLITSTHSAIKEFNDALKHPVIAKDKEAKEEINNITTQLNQSLVNLQKALININKK